MPSLQGRGGQQQTLRAVTIRQIVQARPPTSWQQCASHIQLIVRPLLLQNMGNSDGDNLRVDGADLQNVGSSGRHAGAALPALLSAGA
jgi:hypothetical protein